MEASCDRAAWRQAAVHVLVAKELKVSGIAAIFFGALGLIAGLLPPPSTMLTGLGLLLLAGGIWVLRRPCPAGILISGVLVGLVGFWNIVAGLVPAPAGRPSIFWMIIGIWQIVWSVKAVQRYRRFARFWDPVPPQGLRDQVRQMLEELCKARVKNAADVIQIVSGGMAPRILKIRLLPDRALCLVNNGEDVRCPDRGSLELRAPGTVGRGKNRKVQVRLDELTFEARIPADQWELYETWKHGAAPPRAAA